MRLSLMKAVGGLIILAAVVAAVAIIAHYLIPVKQPSTTASIKTPSQTEKPAFEIYPEVEATIEKPAAKPIIAPEDKLPKVAIIIDDLGYDRKIAEKFLELDVALTFSILPFSPHQKKIARMARAKGVEVMLHLPMEPKEYPAVDPGQGTLLADMEPDQLIAQLEKNLDTLSEIKGVNNHMGSRLTAESSQLYQIFSILKKRGLFFVDSRTTADSLCRPTARMFKVPFAQRDVFLDHHQQPEFIRKQIKELIEIAQSHGEAVGIAHPYSSTYEMLKEMLPELKENVRLVPASDIVRIIR